MATGIEFFVIFELVDFCHYYTLFCFVDKITFAYIFLYFIFCICAKKNVLNNQNEKNCTQGHDFGNFQGH